MTLDVIKNKLDNLESNGYCLDEIDVNENITLLELIKKIQNIKPKCYINFYSDIPIPSIDDFIETKLREDYESYFNPYDIVTQFDYNDLEGDDCIEVYTHIMVNDDIYRINMEFPACHCGEIGSDDIMVDGDWKITSIDLVE